MTFDEWWANYIAAMPLGAFAEPKAAAREAWEEAQRQLQPKTDHGQEDLTAGLTTCDF